MLALGMFAGSRVARVQGAQDTPLDTLVLDVSDSPSIGTTHLRSDRTYRLVVSGTATNTVTGFADTYDAFYCFGGDFCSQGPFADSRWIGLGVRPDDGSADDLADISDAIQDEFPAFQAGHRYVASYRPNVDGRLLAEFPHGDASGTLTGSFTIQVLSPSTPTTTTLPSRAGVGTLTVSDSRVSVNGREAHTGQTLYPGDLIEVPLGSVATIEFGALGTATLRGETGGASLRLPGTPSSAVARAIELIRGLVEIDKNKDQTRWEVETANVIVGVEGTSLSVNSDLDTPQDTIGVTEGAVTVIPRNPALSLFTLHAGQQVAVGPDTVGTITLLCLPNQCDDGEACTVDTCTPTACHHEPASGLEAVCSACRGGLGSHACASQPVPTAVGHQFAVACTLRDHAGTGQAKAAQKLLKRAKGNVKRASALARRAAKKHKGAISADCVAAIAGALNGAF